MQEIVAERLDEMARLPIAETGKGFDLLAGVRVLDLTTSIAGPFATMLLGDMGAEIIKIERPQTGDDSRSWGPPFLDGESLWFLSVNRNKHSVTVDIRSVEGRGVLEDLVRSSDVVVVNQPPGAALRLKIDKDSIRSVRQDVIYVSITGFGLEGKRTDWTCYDLIAEGYSGVMDLTGDPATSAQKVGAPAADMLAGQDAAFAATAALLARKTTGKGHVIDISLVESMTRFLTCRIVPYLGSGMPVRRSGGKDSVIAIYQTFDTADEPITLALGNDAIWARFWEALGRADIASTPEYATNEGRRTHRDRIVAEIQEILRAKPRRHWLDLMVAARVPAGPINRIDEVVRDETLLERDLFYKLKDGEREIPQVGTGMFIDGRSNRPRKAPPRLGSSTEQVLRDVLGYPEKRIDYLRRSGAI